MARHLETGLLRPSHVDAIGTRCLARYLGVSTVTMQSCVAAETMRPCCTRWHPSRQARDDRVSVAIGDCMRLIYTIKTPQANRQTMRTRLEKPCADSWA
jgi:hypothetical protein